ncbi:MAG TPA: glucoamylase family protein [Candidatus Sulfotelmatobacter sp.]|nr:glucoamylase family protein [Candidatus Sulfotelmatobacter sp.]
MKTISRREFLSMAATLPVLSSLSRPILPSDDAFLEDLSSRSFLYFWEQSDPHTGLVLDRARSNGTDLGGRNLEVASTALTGFALTAMCIASDRRWMDPDRIRERVRATLRHFANDQDHMRGWYYHFVYRKSGERAWSSELSTIDTAILLAGIFTAQQYYRDDAEIFSLASIVYNRVDFVWMMDKRTGRLHMGWRPETGLVRGEWAAYYEQAILYLLGIGSPTYPIPVASWYHFDRPAVEACGYRFVGRGPLFTHQFSQAWLDLAGLHDGPPFAIDYFQNSVIATYAHRALCLSLRGMYPHYSNDLWGITPSDSDIGYVIWGDPVTRRDLDGTVVPCAPGGSLMFAPEICLPALRYMHENFAQHIYGRYGFADAFNPQTLWVDPDVVGIDVGITLLSAENLRSGRVWRWFNRSPDVQRAMEQLFQRY